MIADLKGRLSNSATHLQCDDQIKSQSNETAVAQLKAELERTKLAYQRYDGWR